MSVLRKNKKFLSLLGAFFASIFLALNVATTPVLATPDPSQTDSTTASICNDESGSLGWWVCPGSGFLAKTIDGIYSTVQEYLIVKPLTSETDNPFHQVWSIFRDITNIVFVIFFLVVIYSQLTGLGISNYGIKKALPKIIVAAILINLSYIICAACVDLSNILGASLLDLFNGIETKIVPTGLLAESTVSSSDFNYSMIVGDIAGGATIAGVAIALSGGFGSLFLSLIPVLLAGVIAILIAYVTVAARQALVYLLIMVSPLAFVCILLPNTANLYSRWKKTLTAMLVFYPTFSVLFGACSLISWVIIAAAETPTLIILGMAVRVVPLFLGWNMLKMSGTLPGQVHATLSRFAQKPLGAARTYFGQEALLRRAKYLGGKPNPYQVNRRLAQSLENRRIRRELDTKKYLEASKLRGAAYTARYKNLDGRVTRRGEQLYELQKEGLKNQRTILRSSNDFNNGIGVYARGKAQRTRLDALDNKTVIAADNLRYEASRGEKIKYDNEVGYHKRTEAALKAHTQQAVYNRSVDPSSLSRYHRMLDTMEGNIEDTHFIGADASHARATQQKIVETKFMSYFSSLPPTQELYNRLTDLTQYRNSEQYIDPIVAGLRVLNQRGDTDLVKHVIDKTLTGGQIKLGTHASQALANFCMFDVKDNDVLLRRYGKFINLETARAFNEDAEGAEASGNYSRKNHTLTFDEYITGRYREIDPATGEYLKDAEGNDVYGTVKRDVVKLLEGTSLDGVERTAYGNLDESLRKAFGNDTEAMMKRRKEIEWSLLPAFISAGLKYPSGSEQIQNQASFLTGLKNKDGKWIPRWEDKDDPLYGFSPDYFQAQTDQYICAQTPGQLLSLRTDLFAPIVETLAEEGIAELDAAGAVPDWYKSTLPSDASQEEKDADAARRKQFRHDVAKAKFQSLLDSKNKLVQIYTTRHSGAANNSKDAIREFLDLNDDDKIRAYLKKKAAEGKKAEKRTKEGAPEDSSEPDTPPAPTYDNHEYYSATFTDLYNNDPDDSEFFQNVYSGLKDFGLDYIAQEFQRFRKENPYATNAELLDYLNELLNNSDNYN